MNAEPAPRLAAIAPSPSPTPAARTPAGPIEWRGVGDLTPVAILVDEWTADLEVLQRRDPRSPATTVLQQCVRQVSRAIDEARHREVWARLKEVAKRIHRPESTLRRLCKEHGMAMGARKVGGEWMIHLPTLERWLKP